METNLIQHIAMSLNFFAAVILLLLIVCCALDHNKTHLLKIYLCMASSCTASLLLEAVSYAVALYGQQIDTLRLTLLVTAILGGYSLAYHYTCYVAAIVGPNRLICRRMIHLLRIAGPICAVILVAGSYAGLFFTVRDKLFSPARFFVSIFVFDLIACIAGIYLLIRFRKMLNPQDLVALYSLPTLIFIFGVMQYAGFGMMVGLFLLCAVSLVIIYLMIQTDRNRQKVEQEKRLVDMNIAMMLSQIQPHFLYNALSSIRRMIKKDPEVAETAVENFSLYLRQNLESMNRVEPISFSTELKHVKEYLYLEKLRFGERLNVDYFITCTEFALPPLTLQPIVENAVKHGIMKKESGGCVKIMTFRERNKVRLIVKDDGVGFQPSRDPGSDRLHIGFANAKQRIKMQCNGTLDVESEPGKGTTVTITLPLIV